MFFGGDTACTEDDTYYTVVKGNMIVSNKMYNTDTSGNTVEGEVFVNVHKVAYGVTITHNEIAGPGPTASGWKRGIFSTYNWGKDTNFFIAYNRIHGWPTRGMRLDLGDSEIRENLIWDIGNDAIEVDGGVAGKANLFVNNTIFQVGLSGGGNCIYTLYDGNATNWWVNNMIVSNHDQGGCVIWSSTGNDVKNVFECNMSSNVVNLLGGNNAFEGATNYWRRDPVFSSTDPSSATFLMPTMVSGNPAVDGGTNLFGGKSYIGAVYPIPEPALVLGIVMLVACLRRR